MTTNSEQRKMKQMIEENRQKIHEVIKARDGCTALAKQLKLPEKTGRAVVHSWYKRGMVPSWVLVKHPSIFKGIKDTKGLKAELEKLS